MFVALMLLASVARAQYYYYKDSPQDEQYNYYKLTDVEAASTTADVDDVETLQHPMPVTAAGSSTPRTLDPQELADVKDALKLLLKDREVNDLFPTTLANEVDRITDVITSWITEADVRPRNALMEVLAQLDAMENERRAGVPKRAVKPSKPKRIRDMDTNTVRDWVPVNLRYDDGEVEKDDNYDTTEKMHSTKPALTAELYDNTENTFKVEYLDIVYGNNESVGEKQTEALYHPTRNVKWHNGKGIPQRTSSITRTSVKKPIRLTTVLVDDYETIEFITANVLKDVENGVHTTLAETQTEVDATAEWPESRRNNQKGNGIDYREDSSKRRDRNEKGRKDEVGYKTKTAAKGAGLENEIGNNEYKDGDFRRQEGDTSTDPSTTTITTTPPSSSTPSTATSTPTTSSTPTSSSTSSTSTSTTVSSTQASQETSPTVSSKSRRRKTKSTKPKRRKTTRSFTYSSTTKKSRRRKTRTRSTAPTTTLSPTPIDIPRLIELITNLTMDYSMNLTNLVNKTLHEVDMYTCPTVTTTTEGTTTVMTTTQDPYGNLTGTIMGKCFVCGLDEPAMPRHARCADAFSGDFIPLVPVDATARKMLASYRKYCRWMNVPKYYINESDPRSMWGRWTGGCSVRWIDISGIYTQRTCRNRHRAVMGLHWVSKRMAKLEMALQRVDDACIISPMASLVPLSRGVSLYARFHACVCTGSWCNLSSPGPQCMLQIYTLLFMIFFISLRDLTMTVTAFY